MVYSHQMVDTVSRSSCRHDHTCAGKVLNRKLGKAILQIPTLALAMIANMFRLKGRTKSLFIPSTEKNKASP